MPKDRPNWFPNREPHYFSGVRAVMEVLAARLSEQPEVAKVAFGKLGTKEPNYQVIYAGRSFLFDGGSHRPYALPNSSKTRSQFNEHEFDASNLGAGQWSYSDICHYAAEDMPEGDSDAFNLDQLWDYLMGLTIPGSKEQDPQGAKRRIEEYRRQSRDRAFTRRLLLKQGQPYHCAVCNMSIRECLQGAHVVEVKHGGKDITTNGIILCGSHHLMFDAHLFGIEPETREVVLGEKYDRDQMRITRKFIDEPTGIEALHHRWEKFKEAEKRRNSA